MFSTSLIKLACALSQTAMVLSATLPLLESRGVSTHLLNIDGHEIRVGLVPITSSLVAMAPPSPAVGALAKRVTANGCTGCASLTCTNGLSANPSPPLSDDCAALATAINALATSELTTTFPCRMFNTECPNFTVQPGFEHQYSLGTCLVGAANLNSAGGPSISFCDYLIGGFIPSTYTLCVTNAGNTGGFCVPGGEFNPLFAIEMRHSDP
ncbi:hypothetical protein BD779DRAFT_1677643 [Infundibulicybe gibba]|nr:hypothetical protein BD779DRAFT_1677643 [Infundibulicybe gibba]